MENKTKKQKRTKWLTHWSTVTYDHLLTQNHFLTKKKYKHKKKRKFSSFTFSYPSHFICVCRLVQGWNGTRNTKKGTKTGVWRASRGKVQVCHSSCASQYKNATTRTTLLSTRQVQGRPSPPCSLLNKKGLGNWQDSLLKSDAMHSLHSLYVFFFPPALHLPLSIYPCEGRATVGVCNIASRAKTRSSSFVSSLLWQKSHLRPLLWNAIPHSFIPMTSA